MIKNGVQKNSYSLKDYSHERTFGAVDPKYFPDEYNADLGISFPDQNADGLPNACTGYTQSELGQDENGELFDPRFTYEKTLAIAGSPPGSPCQMRDSFKSTRTFGLKRKENDSTLVRGAYYDVDKVNGSYAVGVQNALWLNNLQKRTVSCATPWFHEWVFADKSGILVAPQKYIWDKNTTGHNWKACGWKTIKGKRYIIVKPWCGPLWGDHGYGYLEFSIFDRVMAISGTAIYIQSNLEAKEVQKVKIDILELALDFCRRLMLIIKPAVMPSTDNTTEIHLEPPISPLVESKAQKLYKTAKACIGRNMRSGAAPQEFGCVDAFRGVYREAFGVDLAPGVLDTNGLNAVLSKRKDFKAVLEKELMPGDVQIALTQGDVHGHVLIRGIQDSMSNDSDTGLWKANYHNKNVQLVFRDTLHLAIRYYRPVD